MISPLWFRLAMGSLVRGGIDYRSYARQIALICLFKKRQGDLPWLRGTLGTAHVPSISETEWEAESRDRSIAGPLRVHFDAARYSFAGLNGWHDFLHSELRAITHPRLLRFVDHQATPLIGINVRCGNDFKSAPDKSDYTRVSWLQKTPLQWFVDTLQVLRKHVGWAVPALVVSDGTPEVLSPLVELQNVSFLRPGTAITDLLVLSRSRVLLASGSSTFSAWATFFGQMPSITAPGHPMSNWGIDCLGGQYIGDFDPRVPSDAFLAQVDRVLDE